MTEQTRALKRRQLLHAFGPIPPAGAVGGQSAKRRGTYWGIRTKINAYAVANPLAHGNKITGELQQIRTWLDEFTVREQGRLISGDYALTDAGMRRYVDTANSSVGRLPTFKFPLG